MSAPIWIAVALLGAIASVARFLLDSAVSARAGLPLGTFVVNASGALVLGLLSGLAVRGEAFILAGTATLGSYTTFSTWMFETHRLAEEGERGPAIANALLGLLLGFAAALLGRTIGVHA
jgi:CrcB protein